MQAPVEDKKSFWPYGLIIGITAFVCGMIAMVLFVSFRGKEGLVEQEYYREQIQHQQRIDEKQRTDALEGNVEIRVEADAQRLLLRLPDELLAQQLQGSIHLYRPSDVTMDKQVPLAVDSQGVQYIDVSDFQQGRWILKISWLAGDIAYYHEEVVTLP